MSNVLRRNRKGSDETITRLNSIGLSLATIAGQIGCHPTSITLRLKSLKIPAADTRRAFMEDIYASLPPDFVEELADILANGTNKPTSIKEYVKSLLVADVKARTQAATVTSIFVADTPDEPVLTDIEVPAEGFEPSHA